MKIKEVRDMGVEELQKKNRELDEDLFRFRIRHASGQLESPSSLVRIRRDIARVKTVLREKEAR
jgi:large subunit ribosomal protein L29